MHSYMISISLFSSQCHVQIIIEAISGQTRLSDIAFDDVSILTDQDCSNESDDDNDDGNDTKDPETREDEDGGILNVESCVNRCFEDVNATVHLYANKTLSCSCSNDCDLRTTCCPDYVGKLSFLNIQKGFKCPHFHHFVVIINLH